MSAISSGWLKTWKSLKIENFGTTIKDQTNKFGPIWQITAAGQVMANTHLSIWDIVLRLFSVF
jgi:hypothetical protein